MKSPLAAVTQCKWASKIKKQHQQLICTVSCVSSVCILVYVYLNTFYLIISEPSTCRQLLLVMVNFSINYFINETGNYANVICRNPLCNQPLFLMYHVFFIPITFWTLLFDYFRTKDLFSTCRQLILVTVSFWIHYSTIELCKFNPPQPPK